MSDSAQSWCSSRYSWNDVEEIRISPMGIYRGKVVSPRAAYTHPYYTWWWINTGSLRLEVSGETLWVKAGQWIFIPTGLRRIQAFAAGSHLISLNFFAHWPDGLPLLSLPRPVVGNGETCPSLRRLATRVCTVLERQGSAERHLHRMNLTLPEVLSVKAALHHFVNTLFGYVASQGGSMTIVSHEDSRLAKVLNSIQANLRAGPLPFPEWHEQTGLGRSQLENLARKHLRMSLAAYRNRLLMTEACRRLGAQAALVKEVADALGFVDSSHFCRWLRQHTGRSPTDFRNHPS